MGLNARENMKNSFGRCGHKSKYYHKEKREMSVLQTFTGKLLTRSL